MADDISGIPDVDLSGVKQEIEEEQHREQDAQPGLAQFKDAESVLQAYKEIQGAFTRVSQENKALKEQIGKGGGDSEKVAQLEAQLNAMREEAELMRLQSQPSAQNTRQNRSFDESWMESPEKTIDERVQAQVAIARINDVLLEEEMKNPVEYPQRYREADALATRYPQLAKTPQGVRKLFALADDIRNKSMQEISKKTLGYILGENPTEEKLAKFKKLFETEEDKKTKQDNNAYMPEGSPSNRSSNADTSAARKQHEINEAARKGDVDGVLSGMFKDILAE